MFEGAWLKFAKFARSIEHALSSSAELVGRQNADKESDWAEKSSVVRPSAYAETGRMKNAIGQNSPPGHRVR